jgi:hypothetical protein
MEEDPVLTLTVTLTAFSVAAMDGVVSGSASIKLIAVTPNVNLARALTVAFMVRLLVATSAANARVDASSKATVTIEAMKWVFFIFFLLF